MKKCSIRHGKALSRHFIQRLVYQYFLYAPTSSKDLGNQLPYLSLARIERVCYNSTGQCGRGKAALFFFYRSTKL